LKKAKSSVVNDANFVVKETTPTEDWDGFKKEVEGSSVQDKELILRVLSMYSDPEVREREIKNISEAYTQLKDDILPQLRRSVIKANYQSKVKTDEQLLALASNPDTLKVKELLYTATLTEDLAVKESLYKAAISKNNECYIANNNLGVVYAAQDKMDDAKAAFERSNEIKANNAPVLANLGAVALTNGNIEEAAKYFADAKAAGCTSPDLGYNLGVINIKEGKYSEAIQNFGGTNSFNKALAQTLAKDNAGAESTLNAMGENDNGWFYYLKAIVAAKQGKDDAVFSNLGTAISKSSDVKAYAEGDREFLKYFENETFKALFQ
jgi:predicted Zn-dependent protease